MSIAKYFFVIFDKTLFFNLVELQRAVIIIYLFTKKVYNALWQKVKR